MRDLVDLPLRLVHQVARRAREREDLVLGLAQRRQQAAQLRPVADDLRVVARVAGGRDAGRQAVDVGGAADLVEHPLALELGGDGQRVDRLGAVLQCEHGLEDLLVLREVEILRPQPDVDLDFVEHALGDEDCTENRDLGLEALRRHPVGRAVLVQRRYDCHGCVSRTGRASRR